MAIPSTSVIDRGLELQALLEGVSFSELLAWPALTVEDAVLISSIVTDFSYIDFILRRLIEVIDIFDPTDVPEKWRGKTTVMKLWQVENALQASKWMSETAGKRLTIFVSSGRHVT